MEEANLTGFWSGRYWYDVPGQQSVAFLANLGDDGGHLSGEIIEPNSVGFSSGWLRAVVSGRRDGRAVAFAKTYDGASDLAHSVDYRGGLSDDGLTLTGYWTLEGFSGGFSMSRPELPGESLEAIHAEETELQGD